jgi:hypothetical protein
MPKMFTKPRPAWMPKKVLMWWLESKIDGRWNQHGECEGGCYGAEVAMEQAVENMSDRLREQPPADLEMSCLVKD